ncbi:MAG: hypothetical protein PHW58_03870 [Candidatus Methanofastidiosa archaeon]|nr:hypothetical protein [Candidatus Methanofastidiosa archaeon]MDD4281353.1 hypothetical protein [Candidatus Methanofastidiosa archaeon]
MSEHEMPDPEQIKEILDIVADKVPALLRDLSSILYEPERARTFGKSVSEFYRELKDAGMTDDQAFTLTKQYMSNLNLGGMVSKMSREDRD